MTRQEQYKQKRNALLDEMETMLASAGDDGQLSEEDEKRYEDLRAKAKKLEGVIAREAELEAEERSAPAIRTVAGNGTGEITEVKFRAEDDPKRGFSSHREFLLSVIENSGSVAREQIADERLRVLAVNGSDDGRSRGTLAYLLPRAFNPSFLATAGSDEQGGYDDRYGGFAVGRTMLPGLLQLGFEGDPTAGRTQAVPMSATQVDIIARTDKNHSTSVCGGLTVTRRPETVAATASRAQIEMVSLKATSLFGLAYATEEILTDSVISFVALISAGFRDQFAHHMLHEKLRGLGGAEYIGAFNADCNIDVSRDTASRILGTDVLAMRARCWGYGRAIWIANHDCYGEIFRLGAAAYDAEAATPLSGAGTLFVASMREDMPDMLLGRPIFWSEYATTLGTAGDLSVCDWSQYLEGLYQPLQSAESMHVRFENHERTFKFWLRNAGAPWWRTALTPEQSSTTLSPFVILS